LAAMEALDPDDRRPIVMIGKTVKGYWPAAVKGRLAEDVDQIVSYKSHPYGHKLNGDYFVTLASTFEKRFGVAFDGIRDGAPKSDADRLVQFKTNLDVAMSVLEQNGNGEWLADRLVEIGDTVATSVKVRVPLDVDPFLDDRLRVKNL